MKNLVYKVCASDFHGGAHISAHRSLSAAIRSLDRNSCRKNGCLCGGPDIYRVDGKPWTRTENAIFRAAWGYAPCDLEE